MSKKICIHGHFYQPPREDPWFGKIFLEPSAAPKRHWNERITRESYAPLAWSRRLDGEGKIADLMNCYEWMSFNVGPTLMLWLEREEPLLLERILEADRRSLERWGHGNAIAQIFHHIIMPLASERDKEVEIAWALEDFEYRFKRKAEGIWLSECAVDLPTLEAVARQGLKFVVLSPRQVRSVALSGDDYNDVSLENFDVGRPYWIDLPSGKRIAAFFYEAELAQSVAFEGLLRDGEKFWQKLSAAAGRLSGREALLTLATDGETYGHHFTFGEMALAYVLAQGYSGRDGLELTNFGAYLEQNPPTARARLHEPSSWSCFHGVERWRSNCGCTTGGHEGWNQEWRGPLRKALDYMKKNVDDFYRVQGALAFADPEAALLEYGSVLVNPAAGHAFMDSRLQDPDKRLLAWQLLRMQESALSAYASCAWFFDEISRIEPVNAMRFALRAFEIMRHAGGPDLAEGFADILAGAASNKPEEGSGKDIFLRRVLPSKQDPASLCLFTYLYACVTGGLPAPGGEAVVKFPSLTIRLSNIHYGADGNCRGAALISTPETSRGAAYAWQGLLPAPEAGKYVNLAEAVMTVRETPEAGQGGKACPDAAPCVRKGDELAHYLQDFLGISLMRAVIRKQHESRVSSARQVISTIHPFEEGQDTQTLSQLWSQFAPYVPLAVYLDELSADCLAAINTLLKQQLSGYEEQQLARDLLERAILKDLTEGGAEDAAVAAAVGRVKAVFEHMDWWRIQNCLWAKGEVRAEYKRTAAELGFRV